VLPLEVLPELEARVVPEVPTAVVPLPELATAPAVVPKVVPVAAPCVPAAWPVVVAPTDVTVPAVLEATTPDVEQPAAQRSVRADARWDEPRTRQAYHALVVVAAAL
jgi:hypothetical protein